MKSLSLNVEAVIDQAIADAQKGTDAAISTVLCQGKNYGEFFLLTKTAEAMHMWVALHATYDHLEFSDTDHWFSPALAIRAAMLAGREVHIFNSMREFCAWWLEKHPKI